MLYEKFPLSSLIMSILNCYFFQCRLDYITILDEFDIPNSYLGTNFLLYFQYLWQCTFDRSRCSPSPNTANAPNPKYTYFNALTTTFRVITCPLNVYCHYVLYMHYKHLQFFWMWISISFPYAFWTLFVYFAALGGWRLENYLGPISAYIDYFSSKYIDARMFSA